MKLDAAVESAIEAKVTGMGYELYEVKFFSAGGKKILRVFAEGASGITLDECADISRSLGEILDEMDFVNGAYTLEVSSPGLDRPLVTPRDFRRLIDKKVQVRYRNDVGKQRKSSGILTAVTEEAITLGNGDDAEVIGFDAVLSGKFTI